MTCVQCDNLRTEIERFRDVAAIDLQNAQNDLIAKNREIGRLKAELAKTRDADPDAGEVKDLLLLWKALCHKTGRTYIGSDGKRWKLAKTALKRYGQERCEKALKGLSMKPHAGPRGRAAEAYPGSKRFDDIEHVFGDEERFERCEAYVDEPAEPPAEISEVVKRRVIRKVERFKERDQPIVRVLDSLLRVGCDYRPATAKGHEDCWTAQCPAHDDRSPSLSIRELADGSVLLHCFAGCPTDDVVEALGIGMFELFPVHPRAAA